jgi:RNA polymerase sigma-70 factor (ECF subfamily)
MQIPDKQSSVVKKLELAELGRKIESALEKLPPVFRELFILRHINEFSYEEISEIRNLPIGTVKNRVFRAKEMIRELLEEVI